jgi:hypothetical protein
MTVRPNTNACVRVAVTLVVAEGYVAGCPSTRNIALVGGGGGAGGSVRALCLAVSWCAHVMQVWITASAIVGGGLISANGASTLSTGAPGEQPTSPGGAGGGGRIALYYDSLDANIIYQVRLHACVTCSDHRVCAIDHAGARRAIVGAHVTGHGRSHLAAGV